MQTGTILGLVRDPDVRRQVFKLIAFVGREIVVIARELKQSHSVKSSLLESCKTVREL